MNMDVDSNAFDNNNEDDNTTVENNITPTTPTPSLFKEDIIITISNTKNKNKNKDDDNNEEDVNNDPSDLLVNDISSLVKKCKISNRKNQTSSPYSFTSSYSSSSPNSIQDINNNDNNNSPTAAVHNTPTPTLYRKNHHGSRTNYTPSSTTNKNITPSFNFNNNNNNSDNNNNNINAPRLSCTLSSHSGSVLVLRFYPPDLI